MSDEETRAAEARATERRRAASRAALNRQLAGSSAAMRALNMAWAPIILANIETRMERDDDAE